MFSLRNIMFDFIYIEQKCARLNNPLNPFSKRYRGLSLLNKELTGKRIR